MQQSKQPGCPARSARRLHHEDLDVYRAAIAFVAIALRIVPACPRGHAALADQLRRAALAIPLNIAEGYGKRTAPDRSRFYDIARGSAHECAAILDAALLLGWIETETGEEGKELLYQIVCMLVRMSTRSGERLE